MFTCQKKLLVLLAVVYVCCAMYLSLRVMFLDAGAISVLELSGLAKCGSVHCNDDTTNHLSRSQTTQWKMPELLVYPSLLNHSNDRITNQLAFVPKSVRELIAKGQPVPSKKIYLRDGLGGWNIPAGDKLFREQNCKVQACILTERYEDFKSADVALFKGPPRGEASMRSHLLHQIWVLFILESPVHSSPAPSGMSDFNWTSTYRHDSTIVAPYEKYVPHLNASKMRPPSKNYAEGKTKMVAWFVSNCGASNNRLNYARKLKEHVQVDIFGACGTMSCSRVNQDHCFEMLNKDYKFYLSFENSNCRDYITEKFFVTGLQNDVVPIVMGAAPEDYARAAPPHSFIHVDDFESPKELADYLLKLDKDDVLYNEYFAWKGQGTLINTFFWCRMCALAHDVKERGASWFEDVAAWWDGPGVCIGADSWRQHPRDSPHIAKPAVTLPRW